MRIRRWLVLGALVVAPAASAPFAAVPAAAVEVGAVGVGAVEVGDPVVLRSCSGIVTGKPGTEVLLDPAAVIDPILGVLDRVDLLDGVVRPLRDEWLTTPAIPIGRIGDGVLAGDEIADAAVARLVEFPVVRGVVERVIPVLHATLSTACGIVTEVVPPQLRPPADVPVPQQPEPPEPPEPSEALPPAPPPAAEAPQPPPEPEPNTPVDDEAIGVVRPGAAGTVPVMTRANLLAGKEMASTGALDSRPPAEDRPSWMIFAAVLLFVLASGNWVRSRERG